MAPAERSLASADLHLEAAEGCASPRTGGTPPEVVIGGDLGKEQPAHSADASLPISRFPVGALSKLPIAGFVGHDMSHKGSKTLRVLSYQAQSRLAASDPVLSAKRFGGYLTKLQVDLAFVSESGLRDKSQQLQDFSSALRADYKYLTYNHYPAHLDKGKGVLITRIENPVRAKSITRDRYGRALASSIPLCSEELGGQLASIPVRCMAGYGVTGGTAGTNLTCVEAPLTAKFLTREVAQAGEDDVPVLCGLDANSIDDPSVDCIGTAARASAQGLVTQLRLAGLQDALRLHFPLLRIGTRLCPTGANYLNRIMIRSTPYFRCAAAAVHWQHGMPTDHAPVIADVVGAYAPSVATVEEGLTGMGVDTNVPWRRFATSVRQARAAVERAEALLHGSPSASQHTCPERELLASIDREVQRRRHIWLEVSSRAQGLECESGRSVELRAELGEICRTLVVNVNQVVCLLMPGR